MALSLTQAAKEAKISKSTLSVAVQKGRVSAVHHPDGSYEIEPAELFRVFPPKVDTMGIQRGVRSATEPPPNPPEPQPNRTVAVEPNTDLLRKELEKVEALLEREREASQREREALQREQERVADLQRRLDAATEERRLAEDRNHALMLRLLPPASSVPEQHQAHPTQQAALTPHPVDALKRFATWLRQPRR